MNTQQLLTVLLTSALVIIITVVVIVYELRARSIVNEYESNAQLSQELATDTASDPIVGSWGYTDITLAGAKAFEVDHNFVLVSEKYGTIALTRVTPGIYQGSLRPGDPPTTITVINDKLTIGKSEFIKLGV